MLPELTKKQLAEASGYSYRRLHDIDMELPEKEKLFVKSEGGKYDLALFVQRWAKYSVGAQTSGEDTLDEVRATHEKIKTRKTELEVAQMEGRLVDVTEVAQALGGNRYACHAKPAQDAQQGCASAGDGGQRGHDRRNPGR